MSFLANSTFARVQFNQAEHERIQQISFRRDSFDENPPENLQCQNELKKYQKQQIMQQNVNLKARKNVLFRFDGGTETSGNNNSNINIQLDEIYAKRLTKACSLLVNVKYFYRQLTKNSRIYQMLTHKQHDIIADITSQYVKQLQHKNLIILKMQILFHYFSKKAKVLSQKVPIFNPFHYLKRIWDTMMALLIIMLIFFFSLIIFFELNPHQLTSYFQNSFYFFILDIIFTLNMGYLQKGKLVMNRKKIAFHYLRKNFLLDVMSLLPLLAFQFNIQIENTSYLKILYSQFFLKLLVLVNTLERLSFYFSFQINQKNLVDLLKIFFIIGSVCHIFSLFWHGLALYEINVLKRKDSWLQQMNLQDQSAYVRYIYSFYYLAVTMITIGYGDITPKNYIEICFTVITMFFTGIIYAYCINSIGNIIENINKASKEYKQDMQTIHNFMREENINSDTRAKVSNYIEYFHKESNVTQKLNEQQIISKLSKQLQQDLVIEVQGKYLQNIPIIKEFITTKTQAKIISIMEECLFSPGEIIFKNNEIDDASVYYLVKGEVNLLLESNSSERNDTYFIKIHKNQYFGDLSFITGQIREITAKASDFCRIYKIKRNQFLEIIKENNSDFENFQMIMEAVKIKKNYRFAKMKCYSCQKYDHLTSECPKIHLTLSKNVIIRKYNYSIPVLLRQDKDRNRGQKINTLIKLQDLQKILQDFVDNPSNLEDILEIQRQCKQQQFMYTNSSEDEDEYDDGFSLSHSSFSTGSSSSSSSSNSLENALNDVYKKRLNETRQQVKKHTLQIEQLVGFIKKTKEENDRQLQQIVNIANPPQQTNQKKRFEKQNSQKSRKSVASQSKRVSTVDSPIEYERNSISSKTSRSSVIQNNQLQQQKANQKGSKIFEKTQSTLTSNTLVSQQNNQKNQQIKTQIQFEKIQEYKIYYPHNNSSQVIKNYNKQIDKNLKELKKLENIVQKLNQKKKYRKSSKKQKSN